MVHASDMKIIEVTRMPFERRGRGAMGRTPDCLASNASVPDSIPADHVWGFQRNIQF